MKACKGIVPPALAGSAHLRASASSKLLVYMVKVITEIAHNRQGHYSSRPVLVTATGKKETRLKGIVSRDFFCIDYDLGHPGFLLRFDLI